MQQTNPLYADNDLTGIMEEDPIMRQKTDEILANIEKAYGFVPVVNQILSTRPDMFLPLVDTSKAILERGDLDGKTKALCAVAAASAVCGEYCVDVQMRHAVDRGATQDEVLEAIMIGCYMALTRSQSYALRKFANLFELDVKEVGKKKEE